MDRPTAICEKLSKSSKIVRQKAGLPIDPYFSATKISWIKKHLKLSAKNKNLRFRTIDSFLLRRLTKIDAIESTNASRTSLLNLASAKWDSSLFDIFDVPEAWAPRVVPSEGLEFKTSGVEFLPDGIPIRAALGDQQAALFGQIGWMPGHGKITFGTGSFVLLNTGTKPIISKNSLVSTIALEWKSRKRLYALEGSAFICGAWIQWLRDQLQMIGASDESECMAEQVSSSEGVFIVPALSGMGAPFWKPHLRGAVAGLTRGSNRNHIARASLEALAFQNKALIEAMKKDSSHLKKIVWKVDGGAVRNNLLMQIQADALKSKILRPKDLEATGIGAARLAAFSHGFISLKDIEKLWREDRSFTPGSRSKEYDALYGAWIGLVEQLSS